MNRIDADAPVACSLNDADFVQRRSDARHTLLPSVESVDRIINGVIFKFKKRPGIQRDVTEFVRLEQQCCSFLTFTITPEVDHESSSVEVKIEGPANTAATVEMFAQAGLSALEK